MVMALVKDWRNARASRGQSSSSVSLPSGEVVDWTPVELNQWLPLFILEVRKRDGNDYKAKTLFEYILTIQSAFSALRGVSYSFLNGSEFVAIRNALDNRMRSLQALGLGHNPSKVDVVTLEMEEILWSTKRLGNASPEQLLHTLVYLLGVQLGLRTGEHRKLRREMFQFETDNTHTSLFVYTEWASKNNPDGLRSKMKTSKSVKLFPSRNPDRCIVKLLKQYMDMTENLSRDDGFYFRPTARGFCRMVVGVHNLEKIVPTMMREAGFTGKFTLHSLRATCATRLYEKGVDEQAIQEVTGHTSNAVRAYKRTTDSMKARLSSLLQCGGDNGDNTNENSEGAKMNLVVTSQSAVRAVDEEGCSSKKKAHFTDCTFSNCNFQL